MLQFLFQSKKDFFFFKDIFSVRPKKTCCVGSVWSWQQSSLVYQEDESGSFLACPPAWAGRAPRCPGQTAWPLQLGDVRQLHCSFILRGGRVRNTKKRVKVSHPKKCGWFLMASWLRFSAWQHLSSLNTLWNGEKWFGCHYDTGISSGGAVCLFK